MYFVNMKTDVTDGFVFNRGKSSAIPYVCSDTEGTSTRHLVLNNGKVELGEGENIFAKGLDGEAGALYLPKYSKLTYEDIKDTPENPIIVVLCDTISLYKNVPANIKFLYLGEQGILAALIFGACEFNGVALQRCNTTDLDNRKITRVLRGQDLRNTASFTSRDCDYNYLWDVVAQVHMVEKEDKKENISFSSSYIKEGEYWLSTTGLEEARERKIKEEERKKAEEEARRARIQAQVEESERKRQEEREREAEELAKKAEQKALAKELKLKKDEKVVSVGANAFLAAVAAQVNK